MKGGCYVGKCLWALTMVWLMAGACSPTLTTGRRETAATFEIGPSDWPRDFWVNLKNSGGSRTWCMRFTIRENPYW